MIAAVLWVAMVFVAESFVSQSPRLEVFFHTVSFTLAIVFGMGVLGALYLAIRAPFRPRRMEVISDDEPNGYTGADA